MSASANDLPGPSIVPLSGATLTEPVLQPAAFSFGGYATIPDAIIGVSFWPRVAARLIDLAAHYLIAICTFVFFGFMLGVAAALNRTPSAPIIERLMSGGAVLFVVSTLGYTAYETLCEGLHGSTLGKRMLSMVVVQEDGTPCRFGPAAIRSLAYLVDALFFGVIAYLAMQNSQQEQRHGDKWAHTVVCRRSQAKPENLRGAGRFAAGLFLGVMADSALLMTGLVINLMSS